MKNKNHAIEFIKQKNNNIIFLSLHIINKIFCRVLYDYYYYYNFVFPLFIFIRVSHDCGFFLFVQFHLNNKNPFTLVQLND